MSSGLPTSAWMASALRPSLRMSATTASAAALLRDVVDRDVIAAPGRQPRGRRADAAAGAGDEHDFGHWDVLLKCDCCCLVSGRRRPGQCEPIASAASASGAIACLDANVGTAAPRRCSGSATWRMCSRSCDVLPCPTSRSIAQLCAHLGRPHQPRIAARGEMDAARRPGRGELACSLHRRFGQTRRIAMPPTSQEKLSRQCRT